MNARLRVRVGEDESAGNNERNDGGAVVGEAKLSSEPCESLLHLHWIRLPVSLPVQRSTQAGDVERGQGTITCKPRVPFKEVVEQ